MEATQTQKMDKVCPRCGGKLELNLAYGTDDCIVCNYTVGNSD